MFREMLDLASVDAVLNLVNVKIERKQPEPQEAEAPQGEVVDVEATKKEEE